jgi:hypothetical protein
MITLNDHALDALLRFATVAIDHKVPPVESDDAREQREHADWAENERRWRDPRAEHWWTRSQNRG